MLGGIDLAMKQCASRRRASHRSGRWAPRAPPVLARCFPVTVEGRTLQGTVLPVTPGARAAAIDEPGRRGAGVGFRGTRDVPDRPDRPLDRLCL